MYKICKAGTCKAHTGFQIIYSIEAWQHYTPHITWWYHKQAWQRKLKYHAATVCLSSNQIFKRQAAKASASEMLFLSCFELHFHHLEHFRYLFKSECFDPRIKCVAHILLISTQALSLRSGEGVHADFQSLNADINSPSASYILKLANRIYGENTGNFLAVSYQFLHMILHWLDA